MKIFKYTFSISRHKFHGSWKNSIIYKDFETFKTFKNFKYNGLEILYDSTYTVTFKIDKQLMRRLKILNINENCNKTEKIILYFIENAIEKEKEDISPNYWHSYNSYQTYSSGDYYIRKTIDEYDIQEKKDRKKNLIYQSKNVSSKAKQYINKVNFRK
jgi:hypothetical protein